MAEIAVNAGAVIRIVINDEKEVYCMPLTMVNKGEERTIRKVGGNMIVNVKDSRVAIGKDMANHIMV